MTAVIVLAYVADPANSPRLQQFVTEKIAEGAKLICADSGGDVVLAWNLIPDVLLGDMDSISPSGLQQLVQNPAIQKVTYQPEKDETDLELAIYRALEENPTEITIVCSMMGGRLDHTLGNLYLLAMPKVAGTGIKASILSEGEEITLLKPGFNTLTIKGHQGEIVSLIPFNGNAHGVVTTGLFYPLKRESLFIGPARGISNVMLGEEARVEIESGMLLAIHQFSDHSPT